MPRRGRESWLGLMWEVQVLRRGVVFGRFALIALSEGGSLARATRARNDGMGAERAAASTAVMCAGGGSSLRAVHGDERR